MNKDQRASIQLSNVEKNREIWVGVVPDIFGYGMSVMGSSEAECKKALQKEYKRWKRQYPDPDTNFDTSFENFGGRIFQIQQGNEADYAIQELRNMLAKMRDQWLTDLGVNMAIIEELSKGLFIIGTRHPEECAFINKLLNINRERLRELL